jgi:hypothetical protein
MVVRRARRLADGAIMVARRAPSTIAGAGPADKSAGRAGRRRGSLWMAGVQEGEGIRSSLARMESDR